MKERCPNCDSDQRDREHLVDGEPKYWRTIGVYDRDRDRTVAWKCPDCNHQWEREYGLTNKSSKFTVQ